MKLFLFKFTWAIFWLFFGLVIAQSNGVNDPMWMSIVMLATLLIADGLKLAVKKIMAHAIST